MEKNKIITYSLLAHINNNKSISSGLLELFIPLVKRTLSILNERGYNSGKDLSEIKSVFDELYSIDIPHPVLKKLLETISTSMNQLEENCFMLYTDGAFAIKDFVFSEFDEIIVKKEAEIRQLEKLFSEFLDAYNVSKEEYHSVFDFIEKNKLSISKYLGGQSSPNGNQTSFLIEAHFVEYFKKVPPIYEIIRSIYIGSIISTYIEFKTENSQTDVELVFDTNFLIGLHDLNTPESTHTCKYLMKLSKQLGFKLTVLNITLKETQNLLMARAENFDKAFLQRRINQEDIYNACDRRKLTKTDLERFADNLLQFLTDEGITVLPNTEKYQNEAKFSPLYQKLKKVRHSDFAALHDATAVQYIKSKRTKTIFDFDKVNSWFVHNSINSDSNSNGENESEKRKFQPEFIKVDDLLNIYWLTNPGVSSTTNLKDLSDFGLNSLISCTISDSLPKARIIRELDANIEKYISDGTLSERDIIRIATRISNREINDIDELNKQAKESNIEFIKRLKSEAETQKELEKKRAEKLESVIERFHKQGSDLAKKSQDFDEKLKKNEESINSIKNQVVSKDQELINLNNQIQEERKKRLSLINEKRKLDRDNFIKNEVFKWRLKTIIELFVCLLVFALGLIYLGYSNNWDYQKFKILITNFKGDLIISSIISLIALFVTKFPLQSLYNKYRNHSNIRAYKDSLTIPEDLNILIDLPE